MRRCYVKLTLYTYAAPYHTIGRHRPCEAYLCPTPRQTLDELQPHAFRRHRRRLRRHVSRRLLVQRRRRRERGGGADPGGGFEGRGGEAEGVVKAGPAVAAADLPMAVFEFGDESPLVKL
jgi:hypothetical protein